MSFERRRIQACREASRKCRAHFMQEGCTVHAVAAATLPFVFYLGGGSELASCASTGMHCCSVDLCGTAEHFNRLNMPPFVCLLNALNTRSSLACFFRTLPARVVPTLACSGGRAQRFWLWSRSIPSHYSHTPKCARHKVTIA